MQEVGQKSNITNNFYDLCRRLYVTIRNLEQESKRLNSILFYMTDGVLATNRRGQIIMINDTAKKQLWGWLEKMLNIEALWNCSREENYELRVIWLHKVQNCC